MYAIAPPAALGVNPHWLNNSYVRRRIRRRLLPQPGGFEGGLQIATPFESNDLAVAEGPGVRLFLDLASCSDGRRGG